MGNGIKSITEPPKYQADPNIPPFLDTKRTERHEENRRANIEQVKQASQQAIASYCETHEINLDEFKQGFQGSTATPQNANITMELGNLLYKHLHKTGIHGQLAQTALLDYFQSLALMRANLQEKLDRGESETPFHHAQNNIDAMIYSAIATNVIEYNKETTPN